MAAKEDQAARNGASTRREDSRDELVRSPLRAGNFPYFPSVVHRQFQNTFLPFQERFATDHEHFPSISALPKTQQVNAVFLCYLWRIGCSLCIPPDTRT